MRQMRLRWPLWIAALTAALLLGVYAVAEAHTSLVSSEPAAGSHLAASPTRVRLLFNEEIEPTMATLALVASDGHTTSLAQTSDPHNVNALVAPVGPLPAGTYRVAWHVVSADGHPVGGSFLFTVGAASGAIPPAPAETSTPAGETWGPTVSGAPLIPALLRGLGVGALMAAAGLLFFIVWMKADAASRVMRVARLLTIATPVLLAAHHLAWMVNASPNHALTPGWMAASMESTVGKMELARTLLTLLPVWALLLARRPTLALVFATLALLVSAAIGHSAAVDPMIAVSAKAIHLLAIAAWIGGLLWLVVRAPTDRQRASIDAEWVSAVALSAVIAVVATGIIQTLILLRLADIRSAYGAVVGAKIVGLLALVAFGAYHRYSVVPRLAGAAAQTDDLDASFRTTLRREIGVMTIVILLGGLLSYISPPTIAAAPHTMDSPESTS